MQELNLSQVEAVAGGISDWGIMKMCASAIEGIGRALVNSGLNAREAGMGDQFLEALNGGNLGA